MKRIHLLDKDTINKIKAGEVVERPASIVKELVENSLDANADRITVEIKDGGKSYIRVSDNGDGIHKDDLPLAFLSHATSKITDSDDLFDINTLGFRGEALSSIAAVSRILMTTRTNDEETGNRIIIEGGRIIENSQVACEKGTSIVVTDLFYNTPAREKYMKSSVTEGSYIREIVEYLALSVPGTGFTFIADGKERFSIQKGADVTQIIYAIFGKDTVKSLIPVDAADKDLSVTGFIGEPEISRGKRTNEIYFINGRYIENRMINRAIEDAYKPYLMAHKFPFTVLYIEMDNSIIDVNVHPAKKEAKISTSPRIFSFINNAVGQALGGREIVEKIDISYSTGPMEQLPLIMETINAPGNDDIKISYPKTSGKAGSDIKNNTSKESVYPKRYDDILREREAKKDNRVVPDIEELVKIIRGNDADTPLLSEENTGEIRFIGQIFGTYWILEYEDRMYLIDQHAAHEKVLYERFASNFRNNNVPSQELLAPVILSLRDNEKECLKDNLDAFRETGFDIDEFGGSEYALRAVPMDLYRFSAKEMFYDLLDSMSDLNNKDLTDSIKDRIATMACKAAIKGNYDLSESEAKALIEELMGLENPYNCPHGRPTMKIFTKKDIEKFFKRIL